MKITKVTGTPGSVSKSAASFLEPSFVPDEILTQNESAPISFQGKQGLLLTQKEWKLEKRTISRYMIEGKAKIITKRTVDGERTFVENAKDVCVGSAFTGTLKFQIQEKEQIFGLGQHEDGVSNYRNTTQYLYQNNMQIPMPVFLSTGGYAVVIGAECMMIYEEKDNVITIHLDAVDQIEYYVIEGETLSELVRGIRKMTGKAELLPMWMYGYVQSRERYKTGQELLETAEEFRKRNIPLSCLVQDWQTWEKGKWGDKHLDASRYPDLKAVTDTLHEQGIGFLFSVWPNINKGSRDNQEMMDAEKLYANLSTYDAFDEEARALYWKQCEREIFAGGTDGWWCDSTEPFTPDWNGSEKKTPEARYELSRESMTKYMDARYANAYALCHARGIYENQKKTDPNRRVVNLTRSGYPSIQKYGAILWSGDIMATWEVLRHQITEGLQMAASGIPYWTLDIGAFFAGNLQSWKKWSGVKAGTQPWFWNGDFEGGVSDYGYRELYVRWLQYGTFLPIMRSHGTDTPREPWNFGEPGSVYYDTILKYIRLRYHLLPYIYSLAYQVYETDAMMMRGLVFDYPGDERAAGCTDEFLFGNFLVCPVTVPMEYEPENRRISREKKREVYFPQGNGWFDYETGTYYKGGQARMVDAPLEKMPLYIREGSILPVSQESDTNLYKEQSATELELEIFGGADGSFCYYLDRGNGYEYQNGAYTRIQLTWLDKSQTLQISGAEGRYQIPSKIRIRLRSMDGTLRIASAAYSGEAIQITL